MKIFNHDAVLLYKKIQKTSNKQELSVEDIINTIDSFRTDIIVKTTLIKEILTQSKAQNKQYKFDDRSDLKFMISCNDKILKNLEHKENSYLDSLNNS
jgi:hypothetical protein